MSLPKINYPIFDVIIPSTGNKVKMRPFLVKEEKLLLIAQTSGNANDVIQSIKQVINNCILDPLDVDSLTTFDLEYLFIKLRSKSVNNVIDIFYKDVDDGENYKVQIDLDKVEILKDPEHTNKIDIGNDLGLVLRYPRADMVDRIGEVNNEVEMYFEVVKYCIEKIYDADNVYNVDEYSPAELTEFVTTLDVNTFKKIQKFIETMPKLYYETSYTDKSGKEKKVVLQNLNDFFTLG